MTDSQQDQIADKIVERLKPLVCPEDGPCDQKHKDLLDSWGKDQDRKFVEYQKTLEEDRTAFRNSMSETRDRIFESATGKTWEKREEVRDGICFSIKANYAFWKIVLIVICAGVMAWFKLK